VAFGQAAANLPIGKLVEQVKEQLRKTPQQGIGYGALATFGDEEVQDSLAGSFGQEVVFSYYGRQASSASVGSEVSSFKPIGLVELHRSSSLSKFGALEVNLFLGQQLELHLNVDETVFVDGGLAGGPEAFSDRYFQNLKSLVDYVSGEGKHDASANDFSMAGLKKDALKDLAGILGKSKLGGKK